MHSISVRILIRTHGTLYAVYESGDEVTSASAVAFNPADESVQECKSKTFKECVERTKIIDQLPHDIADVKPEAKYLQNFKLEHAKPAKNTKVPDNYQCIRCTARGKHFAKNCFAIPLKCSKCLKQEHIAKACKSKRSIHNVEF